MYTTNSIKNVLQEQDIAANLNNFMNALPMMKQLLDTCERARVMSAESPQPQQQEDDKEVEMVDIDEELRKERKAREAKAAAKKKQQKRK